MVLLVPVMWFGLARAMAEGRSETPALVLEYTSCNVFAEDDNDSSGGSYPCEPLSLEAQHYRDASVGSASTGMWIEGGFHDPDLFEVSMGAAASAYAFFPGSARAGSEVVFQWRVNRPTLIDFRTLWYCGRSSGVSVNLYLGSHSSVYFPHDCSDLHESVYLEEGDIIWFGADVGAQEDESTEALLGFTLRVVPEPIPYQKISDTEGGFTGGAPDRRTFTLAVASLGDLNGDGVGDLAVHRGLRHDATGARLPAQDQDDPAIWILLLNADGTVKSSEVITVPDVIGPTISALGDLDGDGITEIATGQNLVDVGGEDRGAALILFLDSDGTVKSRQRISSVDGGFTGPLSDGDEFAIEVASLGDFDGDGTPDMAAGARGDDDGGTRQGAVWILFLDTNGTVKSHRKISATEGGFTGILDDSDGFGDSMAALGDLDGDGVGDMAVSAPRDDDGGTDRGAVWILCLNIEGTVKSHQKISATQGGFTGILDDFDGFGVSLSTLGDLDGDGVVDLAVGALHDDDGGRNRGAVWILYLNSNGTVKSHEKISSTQGGFTGTLDDDDRFGTSVASLGDLSGDGAGTLAVNAWLDDDGGPDHGAVWILFMPEPDPTLLLASALGALIVLRRMRHLLAQLLRGELQRKVPGRVLDRALVRRRPSRPAHHRSLAAGLQRGAAAQCAREPPTAGVRRAVFNPGELSPRTGEEKGSGHLGGTNHRKRCHKQCESSEYHSDC